MEAAGDVLRASPGGGFVYVSGFGVNVYYANIIVVLMCSMESEQMRWQCLA